MQAIELKLLRSIAIIVIVLGWGMWRAQLRPLVHQQIILQTMTPPTKDLHGFFIHRGVIPCTLVRQAERMGVQLSIAYNPPAPEAELPLDESTTDGSLLLNELETLDRIAKKQNLTPLIAFMDNREPPDDFVGDPSDLDEVMGEWDQWFLVDDALRTMHSLKSLLDTDPKIKRQFEHPEYVRSDLDEISSCLSVAQELGVNFRFVIG